MPSVMMKPAFALIGVVDCVVHKTKELITAVLRRGDIEEEEIAHLEDAEAASHAGTSTEA